ncbi:hypothetical protein HYS47_03780 [Candidatus Woesearchaeota archaeon]|nr:hypothetical protein [Candidatus Woesearchaeota archaeon]
MQIKDLQAKQGSVELTADVIEKGEVRQFQKFGNPGRVCNAVISDASGTIKLTLWNEQIDQLNVGDKIKITNGYVNEWQGEKQLTTGKFGKMEVLEKGQGASASPKPQQATQASLHPKEPSPDTLSSHSNNSPEEDELFDVEEENVD